MALTKEQILNMKDIQVKEVKVAEWNDTVFIRQLTRGQQDRYLKRQYGEAKLRQDRKAREQEIGSVSIYGHDSYLCACAICDEDGNPLFSQAEIVKLEAKNGSAIGRIAVEIVKFSNMEEEADLEQEVKN